MGTGSLVAGAGGFRGRALLAAAAAVVLVLVLGVMLVVVVDGRKLEWWLQLMAGCGLWEGE